jgi:YgiT-type zinc finger domain-containing protein
MSKSSLPEPYPCPECQAGMMRPRYVTYFTWLNDELVIVPNFPAWICDVCGRREYDTRATAWLATLLNPSTGKPMAHRGTSLRNPHPPDSSSRIPKNKS